MKVLPRCRRAGVLESQRECCECHEYTCSPAPPTPVDTPACREECDASACNFHVAGTSCNGTATMVAAVAAVTAVAASCTGTATMVPAVAAVDASCTGTATEVDGVVPTCDLDDATDGTSECPAGCRMTPAFAAADAYIPTCELDYATDGIEWCPDGCTKTEPVEAVAATDAYTPTCDRDHLTDGTAECPAGCHEEEVPGSEICGYNSEENAGPECRDGYEPRHHNHDSHPTVTYACC